MPVPRAVSKRGIPAQELEALGARWRRQEEMRSHFGNSANKGKVVVEREMRAREGTLYQLLERGDVATGTGELENAVKQQSPSPPPPTRHAAPELLPEEPLVQPANPPSEPPDRKTLHESLAAAVAANLATLRSADAVHTYDQLHSNFSSTASSQPPVNQWLAHQGAAFPAIPSNPSHPPTHEVPVVNGYEPSKPHAPMQHLPIPSTQNGLLAELHSRVADKVMTDEASQPAPSTASVTTFLTQTIDAQKSSHALGVKVAELNGELTKLHNQVDTERQEAKRMKGVMEEAVSRAEMFEEDNRRLQAIVNQCNEEVASTLRKSGEEMAQQWQAHRELQIKLDEQTTVMHETKQKLSEALNELHHSSMLVDGLRAKIREKDEKLKEVAQLVHRQSRSPSMDRPLFENHYAAPRHVEEEQPPQLPVQRELLCDEPHEEQQLEQQQQFESYYDRQHEAQQQLERQQQQQQQLEQQQQQLQLQQQQQLQLQLQQQQQQQQRQQQHAEDEPQQTEFQQYYERFKQQQQQQPLPSESEPEQLYEQPTFQHHYEPHQAPLHHEQQAQPPPHQGYQQPPYEHYEQTQPQAKPEVNLNVSGAALWEEKKNEALEARLTKLEEKLAPNGREEEEEEEEEEDEDEEVRRMLPFDVDKQCLSGGRQFFPPVSSVRPKPRKKRQEADKELDVIALPVPNSPIEVPGGCLSPPFRDGKVQLQYHNRGGIAALSASPPPPPPPCSNASFPQDQPPSVHFTSEPSAVPGGGTSPTSSPSIPKKPTPNRGMGTAW